MRAPVLRQHAASALVAALAMIGLIEPAGAQFAGQGRGPLQVEADSGIEWRREEQVYIARGNAKATRGETSVRADVLSAFYRDRTAATAPAAKPETKTAEPGAGDGSGDGQTDIYRVEAQGNVVIHSASDMVVGDKAVYDVDQQVIVVTGRNLKLTTEKGDTITARDSLEYWEGRALAIARGDAVALHEDKRVAANVLSAHLAEDKKTGQNRVRQIDAFEKVNVSDPQQVATGDKGIYNLDSDLATLLGNVRITHGDDHLEGEYGEVNLKTNVSRILSASNAGRSGKPVYGLIVPKQADTRRPAGARPDKPAPARPAVGE